MMSISPDCELRSQKAAREPRVFGPVGVLARISQRPNCCPRETSPARSWRWSRYPVLCQIVGPVPDVRVIGVSSQSARVWGGFSLLAGALWGAAPGAAEHKAGG